MAWFFRRYRLGSFTICFILSLLLLLIPVVFSKGCKKLNFCSCEMDDGSGVIDLSDIDNPDGKPWPRFSNIPEADSYTYNYNPCTPIKGTGDSSACAGSNLCQQASSTYYPCDGSDPSFTVDSSGHVVMTFKTRTYTDGYTRTSKITLVCDKNDKEGSYGKGVSQIAGKGRSSTYFLTISAKSACPVVSSSLSPGSILLIIFFPLVLLYLIIGILFNIYVRHKQSVPEVLPNHTFWADFPFLVKDGCVFSFRKMKYCCSTLYGKARGHDQEYEKI